MSSSIVFWILSQFNAIFEKSPLFINRLGLPSSFFPYVLLKLIIAL